ncbi:MAG: hypothetical protein OQK75_01365 [Gammaproteobacteria bacterium]|nr:hypothetical protein [Gammaproteobacteria bacterium]
MNYFIKFVLIGFSFLCTSLSIAEPVILKSMSAPAATEFSTVNGIIGLNSESLSGGTISVETGSYSQETPLEANGNFNLTVAANSLYTIKATLGLNAALPDVTASFKNYPALLQGETRTLDLRRPSGQLLGQVNVIGGTAQNISLFITATSTTAGITEQYNANSEVNLVGSQSPEVLFAFPANIVSIVSGRIQITSTNGCILNETLPPKSIILTDKASGTTPPDVQNWTVDVTSASCNAGSISGEIHLNGLDTSATLSEHQLTFIGSEFINLNLTSFGTYKVDPITEGEYSTSQTSFFDEPYSSLRYPNENVIVKGDTIFNTSYPVGTSHGVVKLNGDWNFSQTIAANIEASGSLPGSTSDSLSANDIINPVDGSFDFILINGNWQANSYDFNFESVVNARKDKETLNVELLQDSLTNNHSISEGSSVNLAPVSLNTAMAEIVLLVEQTPGQALNTIEKLFINGNSNIIDPGSNVVIGKSSIRADSTGTPESEFKFTLYGLPGIYTLTASGTGSDGRIYSATFNVTLGTIPPPDNEDDKGAMACFGINKVKLHQHDEHNKYEFSKDKLYIKYAGFRLPDDAIVDLTQDNVSITIDGKVYDFPAGTFKQHNNKQHYHYKSAKGQLPNVKVDIDFKKAKWSIKLNKEDTSYIDNSDGVDISLSIAGYTGNENVILKSKNKHHDKLMYKRKPKLDCRIKNKDKHEDDDDDDDDKESNDVDNDDQ